MATSEPVEYWEDAIMSRQYEDAARHFALETERLEALVAEQAREIERLVKACYQEIPADVMPTMSGYACLLCGWDADPSMPDTHEPSCVLYRGAALAARGGEGQG